MEKEHRRIILDNISELIKLTNYDLLMRKCLDRKIMFPIMKSEIEVKISTIKLLVLDGNDLYINHIRVFIISETANWARNKT